MDKADENIILEYNNYDNYLDSFVTSDDLRYLGSIVSARTIAELGYRSTTDTLSRSQFDARKSLVQTDIFPFKRQHALACEGLSIVDPFLSELALRERSNRLRMLSTIIFIRDYTKSGYEISGYIDYEQSLRKSTTKAEEAVDWVAIFKQKKRLWPQKTDLSYFHWRSGFSTHNHSDNYQVVSDAQRGLVFVHKGDRKMICVDPSVENPGSYTTRTTVYSEKYHHVVLYDHVVRNKI